MENFNRFTWFTLGMLAFALILAGVVHADDGVDAYFDRLARKRVVIDAEIERRHEKDVATLEIEKLWLLESASETEVNVSAKSFSGDTTNTQTTSTTSTNTTNN